MNTFHYKKELERLNQEQRKAVETIEGTVLVVAGPGTGKTQVLTTRIAHILHETDTPPSGILALTFTDAGALAMRKRLKQLIGNTAYSVEITTFHSFANSIIGDYPDSFPHIIGSRQMDELEKLDILESIITANSFEQLKPLGDPLYYLKPTSGIIQDIKREGLSPYDFKMLLDKQIADFESIEDLRHGAGKREGEMKGKYKAIEKKIKKNFELQRLYLLYEEEKTKRRVFDYDDAILSLLEGLKSDNDLLLNLQERYLYILVDEHQDSNGAQNRIISFLSSFHENPNLFIVGDDKQAIYRFQGASLENFLFFSKRYPHAQIIELTDNYRSHQNILDVAHELIQNNETLSSQPLKQVSERDSFEPNFLTFNTSTDEAEYIADSVCSLKKNNDDDGSIAILYRNNADSFPIELSLEQRNVSYSKVSGTRSELHPYSEQLLALLKIAESPTDSMLAKALLYDCFKVSPGDVVSFIEEARSERISLIEASMVSTKESASIIKLMTELHKKVINMSFFELFEEVLHTTGLINSIIRSKDAQDILNEIQKLHMLARTLQKRDGTISLKSFLLHVERARKLNMLKLQDNRDIDANVILSTVHGVKGLEFDSVFVTGLEDQKWGGKKKREYFYLPELQGLSVGEIGEAQQDERRLLYVAITRAREKLILTTVQKNEDGKELVSSRFIDELGEGLGSEIVKQSKELVGVRRKLTKHTLLDKKYIESLVVGRSLNATSVNKYLKCPWEYFFLTLLKLPQVSSSSAQYGTAVHNTLHRYLLAHIANIEITEEQIVTIFEEEVESSFMTEEEKRRFKERGSTDLLGYIRSNPLLSHTTYESERSFSNIPFEVNSLELQMSGKLDKIEHTTDGLIVTDFKTGKPKSRNFLEAKTKSGSLDYKRQLIFYSELLKRSQMRMKEGVIDFIEPTQAGLYKQERFIIDEDDRKDLLETVKSMTEDLLSLDFIHKGCKKKTCEWCRLSESLFS
ncbi:MAG: ATP-dependent DNA helicase [Candidatus Paceibacterota bacterium]